MRKFISILMGILGVLNVVLFWTPAFPTMGVQAFIVGGLCLLASFLIWPRPKAVGSRIQWEKLAAAKGAASKPAGEKKKTDPLLPVKILRLAEKEGGTLTLARAAMGLDVPLDAANEALDECTRQGNAIMEVDEGSGLTRWEFPEFKGRA